MSDPVVVLQEMPATNDNVANEEHTNSKKTWGSYNNLMKKLRSRVHTPLHLDQHPSRASFSSSASVEEEEILKASSYHGQTDGRIVNNNGSLPPVSSFISEQHGPVMMKKSSSTEDKELKSLRCMMATMDGLTSSTSESRSREARRKLQTTTKSLSCSNFGNGQCHSLGRNTSSHGSNHNAQHGSLPPVSSFISEQRGPAMMKSTPDNELQSVRRMMATLDGLL